MKPYYSNPILAGFYPDPSICRVREDYYLINSTFAFFPGIPIFHSKDLVHWEQIGHVLDRPEQLDLDGLGVSEGVFAPAIRYHQGTYYLTNTIVGGGGNFIVTAKNPAGPWSNPIWLPEVVGIDPSPFFDDEGKCYIVYNSDPPGNKSLYEGHRAIWIYEYDLVNRKIIGDKHLLVNGGTNLSKKPIWIEGPHIFKKDDYYYLIAAEGGTSIDHSQVVFRSKEVIGPYQSYPGNPILTQRHLNPNRWYPVTCTGHADFVETPNGEWWAVFLGCRPYQDFYCNTGRETFMTPVTWSNGWPLINPGLETVLYVYPVPDLKKAEVNSFPLNGNFSLKDDFETKKLAHYWIFLRTPKKKWYDLKPHMGKLIIQCQTQQLWQRENPAFIGRRQQHLNCTVSVSLLFIPKEENETSGIVAFQNESHYYYLGKTLSASKAVIRLEKAEPFQSQSGFTYQNDSKNLLREKSERVKILNEIILKSDLLDKKIYLKIEAKGGLYGFYYALEQDKWQVVMEEVDGTHLSTAVAGGFVGVIMGMYASSQGKESANHADYDWFEYSGNDQTFDQYKFIQK
ncbi:MAG: glycoside hydrolase family 43 protein [Promethearchaeota archaeon]